MVEQQPSKLMTRVRFPSPAPSATKLSQQFHIPIGSCGLFGPLRHRASFDARAGARQSGDRRLEVGEDSGLATVENDSFRHENPETVRVGRPRFGHGTPRRAVSTSTQSSTVLASGASESSVRESGKTPSIEWRPVDDL
jgi:hypothetical protein